MIVPFNYLRLVRMMLIFAVVVLIGSIGYVVLEGWNFEDGFYMTIITLSTVGYGETRELSQQGRWYTSGLIFASFMIMTSWTAALTSFLVDIDLGGNLFRRKMLQMISNLTNHTIVCGSSRMSEVIIEQLVRQRKDVVVIDEDEERLNELRQRFRKILVVNGAATNELQLAQANVLSAGHVVAALPNDLDNLLIAITCRDLNQDSMIYAKSNDATVANRMRKAGVDVVVSPSQICGSHVSGQIIAKAKEMSEAAKAAAKEPANA